MPQSCDYYGFPALPLGLLVCATTVVTTTVFAYPLGLRQCDGNGSPVVNCLVSTARPVKPILRHARRLRVASLLQARNESTDVDLSVLRRHVEDEGEVFGPASAPIGGRLLCAHSQACLTAIDASCIGA